MDVIHDRAIPGPGFIASLTVATWVDTTPVGLVAWLLICHPGRLRNGESPESVEADLMAMAKGMRLAPANEQVPDIGLRLRLGQHAVTLDYGHPTYGMRLPMPGLAWRENVKDGGRGCVVIGLDQLPLGAGHVEVADYLARAGTQRRALLGMVSGR